MGFIASLFERRSGGLNDERFWSTMGMSLKTDAGVDVGPVSALGFSAVYACVRNISEDVGKLPLILYRQGADGSRERAVADPLYGLLRDKPNPEMSAMTFRQTLTAHAMLWAGGYAMIQRDGLGRPIALWPLHPGRVKPKRTQSGRMFWEVRTEAGVPVSYEDTEIFHVEGLGFDGIVGYSLASRAKESFGIAAAAEKFAARFFGSGSTVNGVLEHPGKIGKSEDRARLREEWEDMHSGVGNSHKVAILQEGMKYAKVGVTPEEGQFLESRQFQIEEVCRWFRMPPHKVQHLARSTFANIEHQGIEYVVDTLTAWFTRWEAEIARKLIVQAGMYAEHLADALLRGDTKSRFEAYNLALAQGWMNRDEVRARENLPPLPNGDGKVTLVPVNMAPLDKMVSGEAAAQAAPTPSARVLGRVLEDAVGRMIRKETLAAKRAAKKPAEFGAWLDEFYRDHGDTVRDALGPGFDALGELVDGPNFNRQKVAERTADAAGGHCKRSLDELRAAVIAGPAPELEKRINELCDRWERSRPAEFANKVLEKQP